MQSNSSSKERNLTIKEAADFLGVSTLTLRLWDNSGKLIANRTLGGHRRYDLCDLKRVLGQEEPAKIELPVVIYCRVSSHDQKKTGDLRRQKIRLLEFCASKAYKVGYVLEEVGSGLSSNRRKLKKLLKLSHDGKISRIVIEHRDRLSRFMYGSFKDFFRLDGIVLECVDDLMPKSYEEELTNDMIMILASFAGKIHGRRSGKNANK